MRRGLQKGVARFKPRSVTGKPMGCRTATSRPHCRAASTRPDDQAHSVCLGQETVPRVKEGLRAIRLTAQAPAADLLGRQGWTDRRYEQHHASRTEFRCQRPRSRSSEVGAGDSARQLPATATATPRSARQRTNSPVAARRPAMIRWVCRESACVLGPFKAGWPETARSPSRRSRPCSPWAAPNTSPAVRVAALGAARRRGGGAEAEPRKQGPGH